MPSKDEFAKLQKEVERLRKEMNALRRFITIEFDEITEEPVNINIRCCALAFSHPDSPSRTQGFICAGTDGPFFTLYDSNEKVRICLGVDKDAPAFALRTAELKDTVLLTADPTAGLGMVAVFDNGRPRALLKAAPDNAGVVSVVHDDGHSRAILHGSESCGEILAVNPDMKVTVKISSETPHGGMIAVNNAKGRAGVILSNTDHGGAVIVNDRKGNPVASLPHADFGKPGKSEE
jgi:hypothetical protein